MEIIKLIQLKHSNTVQIPSRHTMASQLFTRIGQLGAGLAVAGGVANSALFNVDGGHRAVIFDRYLVLSSSALYSMK